MGKKWYIISPLTAYVVGYLVMLADPYQGFITPSFCPIRNFSIIHIFHSCFEYPYIMIRVSLVAQLVKNQPANVGDTDSIPGSGRSSGGGNDNPLQYSCLENPTDGGTCCPWGCKSHTWPSDSTTTIRCYRAPWMVCSEIINKINLLCFKIWRPYRDLPTRHESFSLFSQQECSRSHSRKTWIFSRTPAWAPQGKAALWSSIEQLRSLISAVRRYMNLLS